MSAVSDVAPRNLAVERVAVDRLRPHPRNPRRIRPERLEQLKRSLAAEPEMLDARPLIALPDGTVVAGNQRLLAAAVALGWSEIPVVFADLTAERATEWMLRDNQGYGEQLDDLAGELLAELAAAGGDLDLTGYEPGAVDALLRAAARSDRDPDEAPALPAVARSRLGEVYELGPHRLMCGDATDAGQVAELMAGESAVLALADPPYNVDYRGGTMTRAHGIQRERDDAYADVFDDYAGWLTLALTNAHTATDDRAALMLWHSSSQLRAVLSALDAARWVDRSYIVWDKGSTKGGLGQTAKQYRKRFEPMWHCHKKGKTPRWHGPRNESDVWPVTGPNANPLHPTMKPVELYERSLLNHSRHGELVVEMFGGSGSSLIASEVVGRRCFAMEIDPAYCDVVRDRYERFVA